MTLVAEMSDASAFDADDPERVVFHLALLGLGVSHDDARAWWDAGVRDPAHVALYWVDSLPVLRPSEVADYLAAGVPSGAEVVRHRKARITPGLVTCLRDAGIDDLVAQRRFVGTDVPAGAAEGYRKQGIVDPDEWRVLYNAGVSPPTALSYRNYGFVDSTGVTRLSTCGVAPIDAARYHRAGVEETEDIVRLFGRGIDPHNVRRYRAAGIDSVDAMLDARDRHVFAIDANIWRTVYGIESVDTMARLAAGDPEGDAIRYFRDTDRAHNFAGYVAAGVLSGPDMIRLFEHGVTGTDAVAYAADGATSIDEMLAMSDPTP